MILRSARAGDLERLVEIERDCFDSALYDRMSERQFRGHVASPRAILVVAVDESDRPLGYVLGLLHRGRSTLRLYSIAVSPDSQGGEVGRLLFERIEDEAVARRLGVQLEVRSDNRKLTTRYPKLGYTAYKSVENYYPDGGSCVKFIKKHDDLHRRA